MRLVRIGTVVPFLAAMAAACAPTPAPVAPGAPPAAPAAPAPGGAPAAPAAPAAAAPERGGVIQIVGIRELPHLNPWKNSNANSSFFLSGVYDQLLDFDFKPFQDWRKEYKIAPSLAERWDLRDDRVTYRFALRRDVKWHDGQPFTAGDVKWSYEFLVDPANALDPGVELRGVEKITAVDDATLEIKLKSPDVLFLNKLVDAPLAIAAKHVHDRGDQLEKVAIGTGPYKLESYDSLRGVPFVRNESYWRQGMPYIERWKFPPFQDPAGRMASFIGRQNDALKPGDKKQLDTVLAQVRGARSAPFIRDISALLSLKLDRPPFSDIRVRQAIHLAIDRQILVQTLTFGDGIYNPPGINGARTSQAIPKEELDKLPGWRQPKDQDIVEAKRLLAEAGYAAGLSFTIKVDQSHPDTPSQAQVISAQLQKIGVQAAVQPLESGVYNKMEGDGDYESYIGPITRISSERDWGLHFHSKGTLNKRPIQDPELDRLLDAQGQEFDEGKRAEIIRQMQRLLIREMYVVPLITFPGYLLVQPYVQGWVDQQAANVTNLDWAQAWLKVADLPKDRS